MSVDNVTDRIARIVENDGNSAVRRTLRVAQSDVMALLSEFMDVKKLDMTAERTEHGYALSINADVVRFYEVGKTTESE